MSWCDSLRRIATCGLVLPAAAVHLSGGQGPDPASLVLRNGRLVTMDAQRPYAEALAVRNDRIVAVGTNEDIVDYVGAATEVIDLRGQFAMPGFIEAHGHFMALGESLGRLDLTEARDWGDVVAMVARAARAAPPGAWVTGDGWHQDKWAVPPEPDVHGFPTHAALSRVSPETPVMLVHASRHAVIANRKAMELAGVTQQSRDPAGGVIVRDAAGEPTGVLLETAKASIEQAFGAWRSGFTAAQREAEARRAIARADAEALSHGVTSFQDAGASFEIIDLYRKVVDEGTLGVRLWVMIRATPDELARRLGSARLIGYGNHHLTVRAIKLTLDGALGSRGAWLLEPYSDMPSQSGFNTVPLAVARETARLALQHDFQYCVHAIGDRANRVTLDLFEEILGAHPAARNHRWRIEHAQHLHPADVPRFGALGVIASMQGVHCTSDASFVVPRLGARRAEEGAYVWRKLIEGGAVIANGTDTPVEDIDPIANYYASVTRRLPDGIAFYPAQRMGRLEALESYTRAAAFAAFEEDLKGSLAPGKLADVTVLTKDITQVPDEAIRSTAVVYTIVGGKVRYHSPAEVRR
jgi:predicted amidohydrolase YtcJ